MHFYAKCGDLTAEHKFHSDQIS